MTLDALLAQINEAVNPLGQLPKTTGPGLNAVLRNLAAAATTATAPPPLALAATLASLPAVGSEATLYVVAATGQLYRWDAATAAYAALALGGGGAAVLATLPNLMAPRAGAQAFSLPAGAGGLLSLLVREATTGTVRPVYPTDYNVTQQVLYVGALARLQAGDYLSGTYFGAAVAPAPDGGPAVPAAPAPWLLPDLVTTRTAEFLPASERTFLDYEITTDGGATWAPATGLILPLPVGEVPAATLGVRVAATVAVPASAATYVPALAPVRYVPGLRARYFTGFAGFGGDFQPFLTATPVFEEVLVHNGRFADPDFDHYGRLAGGLDNFSVFYDGFLHIMEPGTYTFNSGADDTSAMWLGEALLHPTGANRLDTGQGVVLAPGYYPIRLAFSEQGGQQYGFYNWTGPGVSGALNAGRLCLLTNRPRVPDALRAPAGLLPDPDFDQPLHATTWTVAPGWDVAEGVLLGANTDFTTTPLALDAAQVGDQYELEIACELAGSAQLRVEFLNATPASFVFIQGGVQRLALAPTSPDVQVGLRAENNGLVRVHYAQVRRITTAA